MVEVTTKYRQAMDRADRAGAYARVEFDVIDPGAAGDITARSDNSRVWFSSLAGIEFDQVPEQTYATFEPGRWRCAGGQLVPSEAAPVPQGYASAYLSDAGGEFRSQPAIRIEFGQQRTFRALTLWFDPSGADHPARVRAVGYRGATAVVTVEGQPDAAEYVLRPAEKRGFRNVDRVDIVFLASTRPFARARLQRVLFGYTHSIESGAHGGGQLAGVSCAAESDPLCREIAHQDATIDIIDHEGLYAIDNPQGIWEDIETRIPVRVYFGALIPDGSTWGEVYSLYTWAGMNRRTWREVHGGGFYETFLHGSYWLDARPATNGRNASFTGVSVIDLLDAEFKRWPVGGGTLYALAQRVLESVELPRQADGGPLWHLWEGLREVTTTAPMEIKTCREVLQDIAVAGRCTMFFDRLGALHIEPPPAVQYDFGLDFEGRQTDLPDGEKVPELGGVSASVYAYTPAEARELYGESHTVAAGETVEIALNAPAAGVRVAGGGNAQVFSSAVFVTFPAAGTYDITVTGSELEESESVLSLPVEDASPAAQWALLENRLLTDRAQARRCAQWYMDYLQRRLTYGVQSVGFPEVDVYDRVYAQSRFNERLPVTILRHGLRYNGGFWSEYTAKVDRKE